jgi:predicted secreted protein
MFSVLQVLLVVCAVVFIAGSIATLALIPFAVRKGLPSLKKKDIAGFVASSQEVPSIVRTVLLIRKIQTVAWWSALALGIVLIGQFLTTS